MLSVSPFLSKAAARLVLVAYLTQIIAPLAHAMEDPLRLDDFYPKSSFQEASSCHQQATIRPQPLPDALGGQDFGHVDYAVLYQYWVAALNQALPQTLEIEDPFIDYSWTNCGFGNVEVLTDGTVILSQHNAPAELHIQSVNVAGLPLQSPKTAFNGAVSLGHLQDGEGTTGHPGPLKRGQAIHSESFLKEEVLDVEQITGPGKLANCGDDVGVTLPTNGEGINDGVMKVNEIGGVDTFPNENDLPLLETAEKPTQASIQEFTKGCPPEDAGKVVAQRKAGEITKEPGKGRYIIPDWAPDHQTMEPNMSSRQQKASGKTGTRNQTKTPTYPKTQHKGNPSKQPEQTKFIIPDWAPDHQTKTPTYPTTQHKVNPSKKPGQMKYITPDWAPDHQTKTPTYPTTQHKVNSSKKPGQMKYITPDWAPDHQTMEPNTSSRQQALQNTKMLDEIKGLKSLELVARRTLPSNSLMERGKIYVGKINKHTVKYKMWLPDGNALLQDGIIEGTIPIHIPGDLKNYDVLQKYSPQILAIISQKNQARSEGFLFSMACDGFSMGRSCLFNTLNILDLIVKGDLTLSHKLQAGTISLMVKGKLTVGTSNDRLGALIATDGPLTATAHSADVRFGQIYGEGGTTLKTTKGDILSATFRKSKKGKPYKREMNGSFMGSGSTLTLESAGRIDANYSQIFSKDVQKLRAQSAISVIGAEIFCQDDLYVEAPTFTLSRAKPSRGQERSDQAFVRSLGSIYLSVNQGTILASSLLASQDIYARPLQGGSYEKVEKGQLPLSFTVSDRLFPFFFSSPRISPATVKGGKTFAINTDVLEVTGNTNAGGDMKLEGDQLVAKNLRGTPHQKPETNIMIDLGTSAERFTAKGGIFRRSVLPDQPYMRLGIPVPEEALVNPWDRVVLGAQNHPGKASPVFQPNPWAYDDSPSLLSPPVLQFAVMQALSDQVGTLNIQGYSGDDLIRYLHQNAKDARQQDLSPEGLKDVKRSMIVYQTRKLLGQLYTVPILVVARDAINPYQGGGDLTAGVMHVRAGDMIWQDNDVDGRGGLDVFVKGKILLESTKKTKVNGNVTQQYVVESIAGSSKGTVSILSKGDYMQTGRKVRGHGKTIVGSTEGSTKIQDRLLKRIETNSYRKDGGSWGDDTTTTVTKVSTKSEPSEVFSETNEAEVWCGKNDGNRTDVIASHLISPVSMTFKGKEAQTHASKGQNSTSITSQTSGWFSNAESHNDASVPVLNPSKIITPIVYTNTEKAVYEATDFVGDIIYDNTGEGIEFKAGIGRGSYSKRATTSSPLANSNVGCEGWYEVMQPCRLNIKQIVRNINHGIIKFESVVWDKDKTQIIGKLAETTYHLKKHHREWCEHNQVIPNEAIVVVALAVSIATYGAGTGVAFALNCGLKLGAATTGATMANVGMAALFSSAVSSFARTGDPLAAAKEVFSPENLTAIGLSMASVGLAQQAGSFFKINMANGQTAFTANLQKAAVQNGASLVVNSAAKGKLDGSMVLKAVGNTVIDAGAATVASNLGLLSQNTVGDKIGHKVGHFVGGFGAGMASAGINGGDVLKEGLASGMGAMGSEMIAEAMIKDSETNPRTLERNADIARVATTGFGALLGLNPYATICGADNAVSNNFLPSHLAPIEVSEEAWKMAEVAGESILEQFGMDKSRKRRYL